jgi:5-formyltetrahydrofolate cyclo-ligase
VAEDLQTIMQKRELRAQLRGIRLTRTDAERAAAAEALTAMPRQLPELAAAQTIAAYLPVGTEPGILPLLDGLRAGGAQVLAPILQEDLDLDWAEYRGAREVRHVRVRPDVELLEPSSPPLGVDAISGADVVLVPALAVDRSGHRLGRGGGSYDRALTRVAPHTPVLAVVYDNEVLPEVPADDHDRHVTGALTPSGPLLFTAGVEHPPGRSA